MKNYYVSKYLNLIPLKDTYLLFNGFNGCIDEVSKEMGELLNNKETIISSEHIADVEIEFLQKEGILQILLRKKRKMNLLSLLRK